MSDRRGKDSRRWRDRPRRRQPPASGSWT